MPGASYIALVSVEPRPVPRSHHEPSDPSRQLWSFTVGELSTTEELTQARSLLHRSYCEEMRWTPPLGNPSQQRIERLSSGVVGLVDRYDQWATWIGLKHENNVAGCVRIIRRLDEASLELENYFALPSEVLALPGGLVEANRLAIDGPFRHGAGIKLLAKELLRFVDEHGWALLASVISASAGCALRYAEMSDTGLRFKYHPSDPEEAALFARPSCRQPYTGDAGA